MRLGFRTGDVCKADDIEKQEEAACTKRISNSEFNDHGCMLSTMTKRESKYQEKDN